MSLTLAPQGLFSFAAKTAKAVPLPTDRTRVSWPVEAGCNNFSCYDGEKLPWPRENYH